MTVKELIKRLLELNTDIEEAEVVTETPLAIQDTNSHGNYYLIES